MQAFDRHARHHRTGVLQLAAVSGFIDAVHAAQQQRQQHHAHQQRKQDHAGRDKYQLIARRKRLAGGQEQRDREHARQGNGAAHAGKGSDQQLAQRVVGELHRLLLQHALAETLHNPEPAEAHHHQRAVDQDNVGKQHPELDVGIGVGGVNRGADNVRQLQAEHQEHHAVEDELQHLPDAVGAQAHRQRRLTDNAGAGNGHARCDRRQNAGDAEMFGNQVGGERQQQQQHGLRRRIVAAPAAQQTQRFTIEPADRHARNQAADRDFEELDAGAAPGKHHGAHRHRNGELQRDQAGGVIHQRLALHNRHDFLRNASLADDAGERHGVRRRQHRRQREGGDQRNTRHHPVDEVADADHGNQHQHQRQADNFPAMVQELADRRLPAVGKQQRRNKQHQEEFRIEIDMQAERGPGEQRAGEDLHQRQRDLERQDARGHPGERHHQRHNENSEEDFHAFLRRIVKSEKML